MKRGCRCSRWAEYLRKPNKCLRGSAYDEGFCSFEVFKTDDIRVSGVTLRNKDAFWDEVNEFVRRLWFRRAWIVQEFVLSYWVPLMCGRWSQMSWEDFFDGLPSCEERYYAISIFATDEVKLLPEVVDAYDLGRV